MKFSASKAAKEVGKSIPTITKAIKDGRLSATKLQGGGYEIDAAELFRVWPKVKDEGQGSGKPLGSLTPLEPAILQAELEAERRLLADRTRQLEEMRAERDDWKQQAQTLALNPPANRENSSTGGVSGFFSRVWRGKQNKAA